MNGRIQLKLGDLFDGPSDLIILPCSTHGHITQFVFNKLKIFDIPKPTKNRPLGYVEITPFDGAENIAQYVGFAYSVHNVTSNYEAIKEIGKRIGEFTLENDAVKVIGVPLLGAGAGGLKSEEVIKKLKEGFLQNSAIDSKLVIHILHENVFNRVVNENKNQKENQKRIIREDKENLRVFSSYTSTNNSHQQWVESFGTF